MKSVHDKYWWICQHPKMVEFGDSAIIEITPHMVCPETNRIEDAKTANTKMRFWVELMTPFFDKDSNSMQHMHDWELDCGGDTWDEAVEKLYDLVLTKYGDYTDEDLDNQRNKAMDELKLNNPKLWNDLFESGTEPIKIVEEREKLTSEDIFEFKKELENLKIVKRQLMEQIAQPSTSYALYHQIMLDLECIDHDTYMYEESLKLGYDTFRYGLHNENQ